MEASGVQILDPAVWGARGAAFWDASPNMDNEVETLLTRLSEAVAIERVLASRSREVVVKASVDGQGCAVRAFLGDGPSALAEYEALSRIRSPRISALVRADVLPEVVGGSPGGGAGPGIWVARAWIDGDRLDRFARSAVEGAMRQVAADAFEALEVVHASGFVHGDLSPGNLLVDRDGRAFLTDFGMARRSDGPRERSHRRSGTPLFMAPEVLAGARATVASDLFGMAAVLAICLSGVEVDASRFYGRFPAEPFLESAEIDLGGLPEWSRWMLSKLLSRDPVERLGGPQIWSRYLRGDVAGGASLVEAADVPPVGLLEGREQTLLAKNVGAAPLVLISTRDDVESASAVHAATVLMLRERRTARVLELTEVIRRASSTLELDQYLAAELGTLRSNARAAPEDRSVFFASLTEVDAWSLEVLDQLGHACLAEGNVRVVVFVEHLRLGRITRAGSPWREAVRVSLPDLTGEALLRTLSERIDLEEGPAGWVESLDRAARGSTGEVNRLLARASRMGAFVPSDDGSGRARVRPLFRWETVLVSKGASVPTTFGAGERRLVAALILHDRTMTRSQLVEVSAPTEVDPHLVTLRAEGWVEMEEGGGIRLLGTPPDLAELGLARAELASIHRMILDASASQDGSRAAEQARAWVHRLGSCGVDDPVTVAGVLDEVSTLVSRGLHALVASGLGRARALFDSAKRPLPVDLMVEFAIALARCGDSAQARSVAQLTGRATCVHEVTGVIEHLNGRLGKSSAAFERAGRPLQALVESAHLALEADDRLGFECHVEAALELDPSAERGGTRALIDLLSLRATMAARMGRVVEAGEQLDEALARAQDDGGPLTIASVRINRSSFARTRGDLDACREEIDDARRHFRDAGYAPGEAQAQAMLGVLLKDLGQLLDAEQPLLSSIARRERMGARGAAARTRGTLGLLLLERGHLRRAVDQLDRSRRVVAEEGQVAVARLFGAGLDLALSMMGQPSWDSGPETDSIKDGDQRVGQWRAQASALRAGDVTSRSMLSSETQLVLDAILDRDRSAAWFLDLASTRVASGRDGVGARLALEALARARNDGPSGDSAAGEGVEKAASALARTGLERVTAGLDDAERRAAERSLLRIPEPRPEVLDVWNERGDEDMDVMRILELNERLVNQEATATLMGAIVEAALEVSGAERGFIVMSREGKLAIDTAFESSRGDVADEDVEFSRSIVEEALTTGRPLRVSDAVEQDDWSGARSVEDLRLRSILAAPFTVSPILAGVVVVDDRRRPGAFGPREERLLSLLAGQAALALRQVHRLEENRRLAGELRERIVTREAQLLETQRALTRLGAAAPIEGLIGESRAMDDARSLIHRVARSDIAALITGPSGSGKEVAARAIHSLSSRADRPFVAENCAALPASLAEAELFGVKKGAFTGADLDRAGLFERADGGTLFLDEVGELPLDLQAKLLRVLETRTVRRVGEEEERSVDFRLVSATNRSLGAEAEAGRFRADLMYRLDGVTIEMPSLAQRREDIPALVEHFLLRSCGEGAEPKCMTPEVLARLMDREWPGNVRELGNEVARLVVLSGPEISDADLVRTSKSYSGAAVSPSVGGQPGAIRPIAELERIAIVDALRSTGDDKRKAAELLGISRAKIYQRLKEWNESGED